MGMTRTLYPITLFLDVETVNLLIDAINDHSTRTVLTRSNSVKETDYLLSQVETLKAGLEATRKLICRLASPAVTRERTVTPGNGVHASREGGTLL